IRDTTELADTAAIGEIGLNHCAGVRLQNAREIPPCRETLPYGDRDAGRTGNPSDCLDALRLTGFLEKQGVVRLEGSGVLDRSGGRCPAVQVDDHIGIVSHGFPDCGKYALCPTQCLRSLVYPCRWHRVNLDGIEAVGQRPACRLSKSLRRIPVVRSKRRLDVVV